TRGEARKRKERERKADQCKDSQFKNLGNNKSRQYMARLRQDPNYVRISNDLQNKCRK
ncbi:10953_t:CDS:1, partial [Racocetra persica]